MSRNSTPTAPALRHIAQQLLYSRSWPYFLQNNTTSYLNVEPSLQKATYELVRLLFLTFYAYKCKKIRGSKYVRNHSSMVGEETPYYRIPMPTQFNYGTRLHFVKVCQATSSRNSKCLPRIITWSLQPIGSQWMMHLQYSTALKTQPITPFATPSATPSASNFPLKSRERCCSFQAAGKTGDGIYILKKAPKLLSLLSVF